MARSAALKKCVDCTAEGVRGKRKPALTRAGNQVPGGRCVTHNRARRSKTRNTAWERRLLALYGLTADEYNQIKAFQGGTCAICQRATGAQRALSVDHDHKTGFLRGCLCSTCNVKILGHARDDIAFFQRCIDYLTSPPAIQVLGRRIAPIEVPNLTSNGG